MNFYKFIDWLDSPAPPKIEDWTTVILGAFILAVFVVGIVALVYEPLRRK
jgi:hypothetical protein